MKTKKPDNRTMGINTTSKQDLIKQEALHKEAIKKLLPNAKYLIRMEGYNERVKNTK